jgi:glutathione S-transferase
VLKIYGMANSRSMRVVWALEEIGADYEYVKVDLFKGEGRSPSYLTLNPAGKVPVLVDDDFTLTESVAILNYLGDRFPASGLVPASGRLRERAEFQRWCCFVLSELEQPLWTIAKHRFALPQDKRVPAVLATAEWEFSVAARVLEGLLAGREYAVGGNFSAADILIAHTLSWARSARVALPEQVLGAYLDRMLARPALARARERENRA